MKFSAPHEFVRIRYRRRYRYAHVTNFDFGERVFLTFNPRFGSNKFNIGNRSYTYLLSGPSVVLLCVQTSKWHSILLWFLLSAVPAGSRRGRPRRACFWRSHVACVYRTRCNRGNSPAKRQCSATQTCVFFTHFRDAMPCKFVTLLT